MWGRKAIASQKDWCFGAKMKEPEGRFSWPAITLFVPATFSWSQRLERTQNFGTNHAFSRGARK